MLVDVSSSLSTSCCSVSSLLRLKVVSNSDKGLYTCRPEGMVGEDKVALHVLKPPVVEERMPSKMAASYSSVSNRELSCLLTDYVSFGLR